MPANVVERLLVNIEANAAQLQAELAKGGTSVQDFGKKTDAIAKGADAIGQRYSAAAVQVASAAENMARAGKIGGDGLKQIVVQGSNMAFLFGPGGAVVGAVGVASLAIIEVFRRTRTETAELLRQSRADLREIRGLTSREAAEERRLALAFGDRTLTSADVQDVRDTKGDQEADRLEAQRRGVVELTRSTEDLRREIAAIQGEIGKAVGNFDTSNVEALNRAQTEKTAQLNKELKLLQLIAPQYDALTTKVQELAKVEAGRAAVKARLDAEEKARAAAGAAKGTPAADARAAELEAANKALNVLKANAEQNAKAIETAVSAAEIRLAVMAGDTARALTLEIEATSEEFRKLGATDADIAKIIAPLEVARKVAVALSGAARTITIPESVRRELGLLPKELKDGTEGAAAASRGLADGFSDALDVALGIVSAIDGATAGTTRLISGAAQAASGFAKIADLAKQAGGISSLLSTGGGFASALPGIGAIVGGITSLVSVLGQENPETRALREALDRNARRLEELTSSVGELVQISVSGADAAAVRGLRLTSTEPIDTNPVSGEPIFGEVPLSSQALVKALQQAGVSLKELQQIASDFGISFANADLPTVAEIEGLQKLIAANGLRRLNETLRGQLDLLEQQARIDPEAFAGIAGIIKRIAVLTGEQGVPALKTALEGLDLTSADGPAQAIERLKQLLADFTAGSIDLSQLGGLNPEQFAEAIASLIESIRNAAPALRTPATKFAAALEAFGTAVELGSLTAEQKLAKAKDLFATLFPDLAASVDTSSAESFKASIKGIIDGFAADGDLSDAERAQIEVLRALLQAFEGATPAIAQLADALSVLSDRFEIFGTSAADQITAILEEVAGDGLAGKSSLLKNAAFGLLRGLTDGLDLATQEGQAELRARAKAIFEQLSEGGVTAEEQTVIDTIKRILGLASEVADEAARAAADALAEQERLEAERKRQRQAVLDAADTGIKLNDVTDPIEQLRLRVAALAKAFPAFGEVLADFDVSTQDGRDAMEAWIRAIADSPEDLERLAMAMGISVDELLASLLELESGADSAAVKVATLAERLGAAFDEAHFTAELEGITDPLERLKRTAGSVSDVLPEVADIFKQFSLDTAQGRAGSEAALIALGKSTSDAAVRSAVLKLLSQIRGVPQPSATLGDVAGSTASSGGRANVQAAATITEVTGNRMVDLLQRSVAAEEAIRDTIRASLGRTLAVPAPIVPPAVPSLLSGGLAAALASGVAGGGAGITLQVTLAPVFSGTINTGDPEELSRLVQRRMLEIVQGELATELLVALRRAGVARAT